ncbi:MAG: rplU [Rickettsiales bacterium]|jgi:large subunit ribosomal protein L21|nr:rplU [Rickettsiales bacterium]
MFAIVETGGKQYKVAKDAILKLEKIEAGVGSVVEFSKVLLVNDEKKGITLGSPTVEGVSVKAEVLEHIKADKVLIFKKKRRKNHRRLNGHRQRLTVVRVTGLSPVGEGVVIKEFVSDAPTRAPKAAKSESKAAPKKAAAPKAPAKKAAAPKKAEAGEKKAAAPKKAAPKSKKTEG